jgi:arylsulfatase A-like enzyme
VSLLDRWRAFRWHPRGPLEGLVARSAPDPFPSWEARAGAAVFAGLYALSLFQSGPWQVFGYRPDAVWRQWMEPDLWRVRALHGALFVLSLALGAALGALARQAWELVGGVWPRGRRERVSRAGRAAAGAAAALFCHGAALVSGMRRFPALYAEAFHERGGPWRFFQVSVVDALPGGVVTAWQAAALLLLALAAAQFAARALARWRRLRPHVRTAWLVLGGGVAVLAAGGWGVFRFHAARNTGPNVLFIVAEGLSSDVLRPDGRWLSRAPTLVDLARRGRTFSRCVSPVAQTYPALMTVFTGLSPLRHGVRHSFPSSDAVRLGPESLPRWLRRQDFAAVALADHAGDFYSRAADAFDAVEAPRLEVSRAMLQRVWQTHAHLLPYVALARGVPGLSTLRQLPELSDPALLADEAEARLRRLRFRKRFFLTVHFSALRRPFALSGDEFRALDPAYRGPFRYAAPTDAPAAADGARARALYGARLARVDAAVARLLRALEALRLDENTVVALWSPYSELPDEAGRVPGHGRQLLGWEAVSGPFVVLEPRRRSAPRWIEEPVRAEDIGPTLLDVLGLPEPGGLDGFSLRRREFGLPADEYFTAYAETGLWMSPEEAGLPGSRFAYPEVRHLLRPSGGRLELDPAWEDAVLVSKRRMVQVGPERLLFVPTRRGVRFELYDTAADPDCRTDLSRTRAGRERVGELQEILYRFLAREDGWRPQNGFWIPEAFLRDGG